MANKLQLAGRELIKGNFGNALASLTIKSTGESELIQPSRYRNGNFFFGVNGADKAFVWGNYNSSLRAYQLCPVVSTIINRKAQNIINGKRKIVDVNGKESTTKQALAVTQLLTNPNPVQSGLQFKAQSNVYKQIYGYSPIMKIVPVGFEDDYTKWKLWNLPPWMVQVLDNPDFFFDSKPPFESIRLSYMGKTSFLPMEIIYFLKENQIATSIYHSNSAAENNSLFLPDSKLFAIQENIANLVASLESRGTLITERGPQWLLTNDANDSADAGLFPMDGKDKIDLQEQFKYYGLMKGQRKAIITDAKLKLQTVGFDVSQLKLLEGEVQDAKAICDALNYPSELLGLIDSKYDNQNVAERALYTNSIIPDSLSEDEQLTTMLGLEKYGLRIVTTFDHLPALQENIAEKGRGLYYMNTGILIQWLQNGISYNEWRLQTGMDIVPGMENKFYSDLVKDGTLTPVDTASLIANAMAGVQQQNNNNNGSTTGTGN
jgi:hypothetical protein